MLIIAIPKSASTSLMSTLGHLHNLPYCQNRFKTRKPPENLTLLPKYHTDIRELHKDDVATINGSNRIFKQHISPTERNLSLLKQTKKVILLRPPHEIIEAYFRAEKRHLQKQLPEFAHCKTLGDWQKEARKIGLIDELKWFHNRWEKHAANNKTKNLLVPFETLVTNQDKTINRIENFFHFPLSTQAVELYKKRYSRHNRMLYIFSKILPKSFNLIK